MCHQHDPEGCVFAFGIAALRGAPVGGNADSQHGFDACGLLGSRVRQTKAPIEYRVSVRYTAAAKAKQPYTSTRTAHRLLLDAHTALKQPTELLYYLCSGSAQRRLHARAVTYRIGFGKRREGFGWSGRRTDVDERDDLVPRETPHFFRRLRRPAKEN